MKQPKLLIVDGHSILYRAYHGSTQHLTLPDGRTITAVYTFVRTLLRFLEYTKPDYLVITFDTKGKNFRHELYEDYKAHRSPMPEDLALQIPILQELLTASEIKILRQEGVEADDLIGTLSAKAKNAGWFTYILSGDRDDLQLVDESVYLLYPQKQGLFKEYSPELFLEEYQFPTENFVMYKAIVGDTSDNIPGITGLGKVAATKLVKGFKTLEDLYHYVEEKRNAYPQEDYKKIPFSLEEKEKGIQANAFQKLELGKEQAFLSLDLSRINRHLELNLDLESCKLPRFEQTDFYEKLKSFAFNSLYDQFHQFESDMHLLLQERQAKQAEQTLPREKNQRVFSLQTSYAVEGIVYSESVDKFEKFLKKLHLEQPLASGFPFYILRTSVEETYLNKRLKTLNKDLVQANLHLPPYLLCFYEPKIEAQVEQMLGMDQSLLMPQTFLEFGPQHLKVQNHYRLYVWGLSATGLESVLALLAQEKRVNLCFDVLKPYFKTLNIPASFKNLEHLQAQNPLELNALSLLDYSLGHLRQSESLQELFEAYAKTQRSSLEQLDKQSRLGELLFFEEEDSLKKLLFNAKDYFILYLCGTYKNLKETALQALSLQEKMKNFVYEVDLPLQIVVADMERLGISVQEEKLLILKQKFEEKIAQLEKEILSYAQEPFNIQSPKQLSHFLFEELNLPKTKKRASGYSTAQEDLEELESLHPVIALIQAYRYYTKLLATFILGLLSSIQEDGRVHTTLELEKTSTGRLSSINPNLQNIPVKQEIGREIREAFCAGAGKVLLVADYSQIELRFLAHLSEDEAMIETFKAGQDIHYLTAKGLFPDLEEIGFYERQIAKTINFSVMYGISEFSLSKDLGISFKEAKQYIESYYRRYPAVSQFMSHLIEQASQKGYSETMLGRRRFIEEFKSKNAHVRQFAERVAMNAPIQGSAADLIRMAMVRVALGIQKQGLDAQLLLQVHDELILEVNERDLVATKQLLQQSMEEALVLKVPLIAEVKVLQNWGESKV